tara:strand:- start:369 stop:632 length:264 start_codon:yes stop_codon:yes gene_type:complete
MSKYTAGDKYSNDFDYSGMLDYALKTTVNTPVKDLKGLHASATDVNYHTSFRNLSLTIECIEYNDEGGAKKFMELFHEDVTNEINNF